MGKKLLPLIENSVLADEDKLKLYSQFKKLTNIEEKVENAKITYLDAYLSGLKSKILSKRVEAYKYLVEMNYWTIADYTHELLVSLENIALVRMAVCAAAKLNLKQEIPRLGELLELQSDDWIKIDHHLPKKVKAFLEGSQWFYPGLDIQDETAVTLIYLSPLPADLKIKICTFFDKRGKSLPFAIKIIFYKYFLLNNEEKSGDRVINELSVLLQKEWAKHSYQWKYSDEYNYFTRLLDLVSTFKPKKFEKFVFDLLNTKNLRIHQKYLIDLLQVASGYPCSSIFSFINNLSDQIKVIRDILHEIITDSPTKTVSPLILQSIEGNIMAAVQKLDSLSIEVSETIKTNDLCR